MVLKWDQTEIHYVPVSNWTMAEEGSKPVEIVKAEDKCQITAVLCVTKSGSICHPMLGRLQTKVSGTLLILKIILSK